ncbi:hypothetical protein R3P38DRAFT_3359770 [Favolaschia claudopus]|uniref:Uncharacterized protein n=1 Tax=Favolaschia claudopus TaxID=2862362 RepID=A0AAW0B2Z4_9AGAR
MAGSTAIKDGKCTTGERRNDEQSRLLNENAKLMQSALRLKAVFSLSFFEDDRRSGRWLADEDWFARRRHRSGFSEPRQREDVEESRSALAAIINTERIVWKQLYTRRDRLFRKGVSQLGRNRGGLRSKARAVISRNAGLYSAALAAKRQPMNAQETPLIHVVSLLWDKLENAPLFEDIGGRLGKAAQKLLRKASCSERMNVRQEMLLVLLVQSKPPISSYLEARKQETTFEKWLPKGRRKALVRAEMESSDTVTF